MKKESLLSRAKKHQPKRTDYSKINQEDIDLVLGWVNGDITTSQMCFAKGLKQRTGNYLYYCASVLRNGVNSGKIKIIKIIKDEEG